MALLELAVILSPCAYASDFHSPRTSGLGGAGHAAPLNNDAIYLNPSYVALLPAYSVAANYFTYYGEGTNTADYHGMGYNLSVEDGRSDLFEAGIGLTHRQDADILNIGASKQAIKNLGVSIGTKVYRSRELSPNPGDMIWDGVASATYVINDMFQVALVVDNFIQTNDALAHNLTREFIAAGKINLSSLLLLYIDPHLAPSAQDEWGLETGLEIPFFTDFFLRMGMYRNSNIPWENTRGNGYGIGVGWLAPKISFDYGLEHTVGPISAFQHVFGVTIYL